MRGTDEGKPARRYTKPAAKPVFCSGVPVFRKYRKHPTAAPEPPPAGLSAAEPRKKEAGAWAGFMLTMRLLFVFAYRSNSAKCLIFWGDRRGSNPRQPESQSGTLPTELQPPLKKARIVTKIAGGCLYKGGALSQSCSGDVRFAGQSGGPCRSTRSMNVRNGGWARLKIEHTLENGNA